MAMAVAVCKPLSAMLPSSLPTHRDCHSVTLSTRQQIKSHDYQRQDLRSINASFVKAFHHKRVINTRQVQHIRALRQGDGGKEKRDTEGGVEDANTDAPSCEEISESKSPDPLDETQQQSSSAGGTEKREPGWGGLHGLANKLGFRKNTTSSKDEDFKRQERQQQEEPGKQEKNSKQGARCRWRSLWRTVRRPQNLLAAFLTGLLLYAIALFGWQVMVVAVDVTLFVLKCSFVAIVLLLVYILLI